MSIDEAVDLMRSVQKYERAWNQRMLLEAGGELARAVRRFVGDEAEAGGWFCELEEAIGEGD